MIWREFLHDPLNDKFENMPVNESEKGNRFRIMVQMGRINEEERTFRTYNYPQCDPKGTREMW